MNTTNKTEPKTESGASLAPARGSNAPLSNLNYDADDDYWDGNEEPSCPSCGGEGMMEYNEAGPSAWGEDCPSEMNHMVTCPNCRGSGLMKDASSC